SGESNSRHPSSPQGSGRFGDAAADADADADGDATGAADAIATGALAVGAGGPDGAPPAQPAPSAASERTNEEARMGSAHPIRRAQGPDTGCHPGFPDGPIRDHHGGRGGDGER